MYKEAVMGQTATIKKKYTYEDYLKTPDNERYELIEGDLLMTPSPKTVHQRIAGKLDYALRKHVIEHGLGEVFFAPFDVYLDADNVVQPDLLFVAKGRLNVIGEDNIQGAPDLVVEILSESSAYRDTIQKKMLYARFGVKEYWIVAPKEAMIEVYALKNKEYTLAGTFLKAQPLVSGVLADFRLDLAEIF
jgi:Uma2 family endonuclease